MTPVSRRTAVYLGGGVLFATAFFFHRLLLSGKLFIARDMLRVYLPVHAFWAQRVLHGSIPDWYPFDGLGQPFAGMVVSGAFHPLNLTYLVLPAGAALTLNTVLCFPAAFSGVYALAQRFGADVPAAVLGGLVFAFSGYLVSTTNNIPYLMAAAAVPWALWGADRFLQHPSWPRASAAGGLTALVLFAGDVQAFAVTLFLFAALVVCRRARWVWGALLVVSALVAGTAQLVPSWHVLSQARAGQQSFTQAAGWSTHPLRLLEMALGPLFALDPNDPVGSAIATDLLDTEQGTLWADTLYLGLPAVFLALLGAWVYRRSRTGRTLFVCTALLLALALGKHAGLAALAFKVIPFWSAFRYPEKCMALVSLGIALGAAGGLQAVLEQPAVRRQAGILLGIGGGLALSLGAEEAWFQLGGRWMASRIDAGDLRDDVAAHIASALARGAVISGVLACVVAATFLWARHARVVAWVPVVCSFLGLFSLNEPQYEVSPPELLDLASPFRTALQGTAWRVLYLGGAHLMPIETQVSAMDRWALLAMAALEPVTPALFAIEGANTYLPGVSLRVSELRDDERKWVLERAGLFSVRFFSVAQENKDEVVASGKPVIETLPSFGYFLLEDRSALPRAYLARPLCVSGPADSLGAVRAGSFVRGVEAVVECSHPLAAPSGELGEVISLASEPERVVVKVHSKLASVLVLNDAYYSGWRATVDGASAPILVANHAVRAVAVEPGMHEVVFTYRTPGLWLAICVSLVFLLLGAGASLRAAASRQQARSPR